MRFSRADLVARVAHVTLLHTSICTLFDRSVIAYGDCTALVCGRRQITYRELDEASTRIALRLREAGVGKGEIVALVAQRSVEAIAGILGVVKAGAAYLPLDLSYPPEWLRYIYDDSRPKLTLVQHSFSDSTGIPPIWTGQAIYLTADCFSREPGETEPGTGVQQVDLTALEPPIGAEDLAYLMYTSGSTGRPKGVMIPHRGVMRLVSDCDFATLEPAEVILHLAPLSFDASTFEIWGALLNGGRLAVMPASHPSLDDIAEAIGVHEVTTLWLTAGLFNLMVERRLDALKPLRQLLAGGDVLSPSHVAKALEALPSCRIVNGYGPTENTTFTCCYTIPRDRPCNGSIPIGSAIRGTVVHVLDEAMQPVPDGEEGELYAGGAGVARGYLNRPELTAEKFVADPFDPTPGARLYRTGDEVRRRPDGNLEFLGRVDRQLKINGKRVELDEIEACLRRAPTVRDAAVVSRTDGTGRRSVAAFVTPWEGKAVDVAELRAFLRLELPDFMVPAEIALLDALPLSPTGKVDRAQLSRLFSPPAMPTGARPLQPDDCTQGKLQTIWSSILGRDTVGVDDNFFDLGGTSLQLIEAHARISDACAVPISLMDLFEHPTIRGVAAKIDGNSSAKQTLMATDERARRRSAALARAQGITRRMGAP